MIVIDGKSHLDILVLYEAKEDQCGYLSSGVPLYFDIYNKQSNWKIASKISSTEYAIDLKTNFEWFIPISK